MFLLRFFRYLRGYVWFEARGVFVERFLNLIARNRIPVWSGSKRGEVYTGCVTARDYRKLRAHAKKAEVRLRVTDKRGAPFQTRKYRGRTGLLIGVVVFFAFVFGMSRFIWRIEIGGNESIDDMTILQALESLEITPGTLRSAIDVRDCERKMLLLVPELSWAALNIDGSAIRVEVSESIQPPEMVDPTKPCNVVAAEAGQIVAMNVYDGQTIVQVGDTVLPGDLIVSGITLDGRGQSLFKHARAEVIAETTQTLEIDVPLEQTAYVETGKSRVRRYLGVFGIELPFFLPLSIEAPYRVERVQEPVTFFSMELPLTWMREEYVFMEQVPVTLTEAEAKAQAMESLDNLVKARLGEAEILDQQVTGELRDDNYVLSAVLFCKLDIAVEQEILVESGEGEHSSGTNP